MPIRDEFLELLQCPGSGQRLRNADSRLLAHVNAAIAENRVYNRLGELIDDPLEDALVTEDNAWVYPVADEIPTLIPDEGLSVADLDLLADEPGDSGNDSGNDLNDDPAADPKDDLNEEADS